MNRRSPLAHPRLQIRQEELAVEGVNGSHIREDALHHLDRKRPLPSLLCEFGTEHLERRHTLKNKGCSDAMEEPFSVPQRTFQRSAL